MTLITFFSLLDNGMEAVIGMRKHGQHSSDPCSMGKPERHVPGWMIMTAVPIKLCNQHFIGDGGRPQTPGRLCLGL